MQGRLGHHRQPHHGRSISVSLGSLVVPPDPGFSCLLQPDRARPLALNCE